MKILLVLPVGSIATSLSLAFATRGWSVVNDPSGQDAEQIVAADGCDAVLIDSDALLANMGIARLRRAAPDLAILTLGRTPGLVEMERLFDAGADDVLSHPVAPAEILLRVRAIARRRHGHAGAAIRFGKLAVWPGSHAEVDGARLHLTMREFVIIERLALRAGRAVGRDALMSALYSGPDEPDGKVVDVFLCRIRKLLAAHGLPSDLIETIWGQGWRLPPPFAIDEERSLPGLTSHRLRHSVRAAAGAAA